MVEFKNNPTRKALISRAVWLTSPLDGRALGGAEREELKAGARGTGETS